MAVFHSSALAQDFQNLRGMMSDVGLKFPDPIGDVGVLLLATAHAYVPDQTPPPARWGTTDSNKAYFTEYAFPVLRQKLGVRDRDVLAFGRQVGRCFASYYNAGKVGIDPTVAVLPQALGVRGRQFGWASGGNRVADLGVGLALLRHMPNVASGAYTLLGSVATEAEAEVLRGIVDRYGATAGQVKIRHDGLGAPIREPNSVDAIVISRAHGAGRQLHQAAKLVGTALRKGGVAAAAGPLALRAGVPAYSLVERLWATNPQLRSLGKCQYVSEQREACVAIIVQKK